MAKRVSKHISNPKDVEEIVNITHEKASEKNTVMEYFADFGDGARFNPYDTIDIPVGKYGQTKKNTNKFTTTIGLWIFNKSFIEPMADELGYINHTMSNKEYGELNQKMSYARLEDRITLDQMKDFLNQTQILMSCCSALSPSHTDAMFEIEPKIAAKKKELMKKYAVALEEKNVTEIAKMEEELIDYAKELLRDDPAADMFNSGARSSWSNNFKNMYLMKGPIRLTDGSYDIITTSYIEGMKPEDFAKINDSAVGGPYSRARKTMDGGYKEKQFTNATQHIKVMGEGSDCGTKKTIEIHLTKDNINKWMYCFFVNSSGRLEEITSENADKLIGKTVKMRFSSLCESGKEDYICEKCLGTLYRRLGITNVGLGVMVMMSALKNRAMKAFHDSSLKVYHVKPDDIF